MSITCRYYLDIDHFRNVLYMNIAYRYESSLRHGDYLPRPIVGLLELLYSLVYLFLADCAKLLLEKVMNNYYKSLIQLFGLDKWRNGVI